MMVHTVYECDAVEMADGTIILVVAAPLVMPFLHNVGDTVGTAEAVPADKGLAVKLPEGVMLIKKADPLAIAAVDVGLPVHLCAVSKEGDPLAVWMLERPSRGARSR